LHRHLDAQFYQQRPAQQIWRSPHQVTGLMSRVLSLLAWEGNLQPEQAVQAFAVGMEKFLGGKPGQPLLVREDCTLVEFDAALRALTKAVPSVKRRVIGACTACILEDQQVTVREVEVLRAICDTLDCPMPPLVLGDAESHRALASG
jgi:hypothetical protein